MGEFCGFGVGAGGRVSLTRDCRGGTRNFLKVGPTPVPNQAHNPSEGRTRRRSPAVRSNLSMSGAELNWTRFPEYRSPADSGDKIHLPRIVVTGTNSPRPK